MDLGTRIAIASFPFAIGIALIVACMFYEGHEIRKRRLRWLLFSGWCMTLVSFLLIIVLPKEEHPELTLKILSPTYPVVEIYNDTNVVAQTVGIYPVLWNLDRPEDKSPLSLLPAKLDYVPAKASNGPFNIFQTVATQFTKGVKLFGFISSGCPACTSVHYYWVYIEWGVGGWYAEVPVNIANTWAMLPANRNPNIIEYSLKNIASVPDNERIAFGPMEP